MQKTLETTLRQLKTVFNAIKEEEADIKIATKVLSPRQILVSLCKSPTTYLAETEEKQYLCGTHSLENQSVENLKKIYFDLRNKVIRHAEEKDDLETISKAITYLSIHESHHIGALCLFLTQINPKWDTSAIYTKECALL